MYKINMLEGGKYISRLTCVKNVELCSFIFMSFPSFLVPLYLPNFFFLLVILLLYSKSVSLIHKRRQILGGDKASKGI